MKRQTAKYLLQTIVVSLLVLFSTLVSAKDSLKERKSPPPKKVTRIQRLDKRTTNMVEDVQTREKLQLARKLIMDKNFMAASAVLETIYEINSSHPTVISLLIRCYDNLLYFQKAEDMVRREIVKFPDNYYYHQTLAQFLAKQERIEEALASYNKSLSLILRKDINRYLSIVNSMTIYGLEIQAVKLIDSLRKKFENETLFAIQKGNIYKNDRKYELATNEYCLTLSDSTRIGNDGEKKLLDLLLFGESSLISENILKKRADSQQEKRLLNILTSFYLKESRFDDAFNYSIRLDSIENKNGQTLFNYLRQTDDQEIHQQTIKMSRYIIEKNSNQKIDSQLLSDTYFKYAGALAKDNRPKEAILVYDSLFDLTEKVQTKSETLYNIGKIYSDIFFDYEKSLIYFDSVIKNYRGGMGYLNSQIAFPQSKIHLRQFSDARAAYEKLKQKHLSPEHQEEITFNLVLIDFYENKFDSAKTGFKRLINNFPRGFYVNDALELIRVIDGAIARLDVLKLFANYYFYSSKNDFVSAETELLKITKNFSSLLADMALYKLVNISMMQGDSPKTIRYISEITEKFPDSYYLPYCLKIEADIYFGDDLKRERAEEIYKMLLEKHPNYPFIAKIREILKSSSEEKSLIG